MTEREMRALVARWSATWGTRGLEREISIAFSSRLRATLGRCRPAAGRVTLRADLLDAPPDRLADVLCHEVAHVAAHRLHGPRVRPHGPEWQRLVAAAGFEPRVRALPDAGLPAPSASGPPLRKPVPRRYAHRCPVCHAVRYAGRAVRAWRCAECLDAGLTGEMVISRVDPVRGGA